MNMYTIAFLLHGKTMKSSLCLGHGPCNATSLWIFSYKLNDTEKSYFFSL